MSQLTKKSQPRDGSLTTPELPQVYRDSIQDAAGGVDCRSIDKENGVFGQSGVNSFLA